MKKSTILIALILTTGTLTAQNRGGRGGNKVVYIQTSNPTNLSNGNMFNNSNLDNNINVQNYAYNNVQTSNVNFNNVKVQQQVSNPVNRNVTANVNRNVINNVSNEDIQVLNFNGNRGVNNVTRNVESVSNVNDNNLNVRNVVPQELEQQQINVMPAQQIVLDNVDNELAMNVIPNINVPQIDVPEINVPEMNVNVDPSLNLEIKKQTKVQTDKVEKVKEVKIKEEKEVNVSIEMPEISFGKAGKSSVSGSSKKTKVKRGFSYKQHVSIFEKIAAKTSGIKKLFKKKEKKTTCTVVCFEF